jgi:hypothetical protein
MLIRPEEKSVLLVSQPAHAWVTGQLARSWGNDEFPRLSEEVCLAAEQHDIGFLPWEKQPTLNRDTGLPHNFLELPVRTHFEIWTNGIQDMQQFGRYPALLVSMHFTSLARRMGNGRPESDLKIAEKFLEEQEVLQTSLATSLANDFHYDDRSNPKALQESQEIVSLLDWISLQVLFNFREDKIAREVESRPGAANFKLTPRAGAGQTVEVDPWPFRTPTVRLACDGKRLLRTYDDEHEMREAIRAAAPVTVLITLTPPRDGTQV